MSGELVRRQRRGRRVPGMAKVVPLFRSKRPQPTIDLDTPDLFGPDQHGLGAWVRETFIDDDGPLFNERHTHLADASIGWLWTTAEQNNRDRPVAGECRLIGPATKKWSRAMADFQLRGWFGYVPDFLITIDAGIASSMDDWSFCALIEHELCHAAQDVDMHGAPRFNRDGAPIFRLVAHDCEEFVEVVARYGSTGAIADMVRAANNGPTIREAQMSAACGTCLRRMA